MRVAPELTMTRPRKARQQKTRASEVLSADLLAFETADGTSRRAAATQPVGAIAVSTLSASLPLEELARLLGQQAARRAFSRHRGRSTLETALALLIATLVLATATAVCQHLHAGH